MPQRIESLSSVGLDIGKNVLHLVGFSPEGEVVLRRKVKRMSLEKVFDPLPRCIVGMEACLSAHFISLSHGSFGSGSDPNMPVFAPSGPK